ncbi:MAG: helix-turn-helix domain-containing protein, partial [Candidatus Limnocylindria bacterium]
YKIAETQQTKLKKYISQLYRSINKQRGLSQERLGLKAGLSGKFIGEVERGEKSISIDSLYHLAVALAVPLRHLTDVRPGRRTAMPSEAAERLFALVCAHRRPGEVRKALSVVRAMLGGAA